MFVTQNSESNSVSIRNSNGELIQTLKDSNVSYLTKPLFKPNGDPILNDDGSQDAEITRILIRSTVDVNQVNADLPYTSTAVIYN